MSERCDRCGALYVLVGFVHRCIPRVTAEPKCTAHADRPVKTKNPKPTTKGAPKKRKSK